MCSLVQHLKCYFYRMATFCVTVLSPHVVGLFIGLEVLEPEGCFPPLIGLWIMGAFGIFGWVGQFSLTGLLLVLLTFRHWQLTLAIAPPAPPVATPLVGSIARARCRLAVCQRGYWVRWCTRCAIEICG